MWIVQIECIVWYVWWNVCIMIMVTMIVVMIIVSMHVMMHDMMMITITMVADAAWAMSSSLIVRHIRQRKTKLFPEKLVTPLQIGVGLKVQPDVRVKVLLGNFPQQDDDESLPSVPQNLVVRRFELEPAPLWLDEVFTEHHDCPARWLHRLHNGVSDEGADREVPVVQAQLVGGVTMLQQGCQLFRHERLVFGAVADEGVEKFFAVI